MISRATVRVLAVLSALLLTGCEYTLLDPKGPIAEQEMWLMIIAAAVMLIVVIPVTVMGVWFPIRYGANKQREYKPNWEHSNRIETVVWAIPILIILTLGTITYITSYTLDPRKPIESDNPTQVIQVIALDWKWLFIYPEEGIATVNEIAVPLDTPVEFLITSDSVMNSFFIPHLGTQIYAMSGMENRVHLMATEPGEFMGFSSNYSGFGFSGMKFKTIATDRGGYETWLADVRRAPNPLDEVTLAGLREKSRDVPAMYFSDVDPLLFSNIIDQYEGALNGE
ncbi:MAG: ubiquinol oxidase subunit II [Pseudomonadota bacterium]